MSCSGQSSLLAREVSSIPRCRLSTSSDPFGISSRTRNPRRSSGPRRRIQGPATFAGKTSGHVRIDTVATRLRATTTNRLGQFPGGEVHLADQTIAIPCEDQATADRSHLSAKELLNRVGGRAWLWRRQILPPQRRLPELVIHNEALIHGTDVEIALPAVDGD